MSGTKIRLDKFLAEMGLGTRSEVKKILKTGQITVNGVTEKKPETKIAPKEDEIFFSNQKLSYCPFVYYLFHKPAGCITATKDSYHKTVMDYMPDANRLHLFPVGRLDIDTEGLLLITNDGDLAHNLLSPAKHIEKTYFAKIEGVVTEEDVLLFSQGIDIGEKKKTKPSDLTILKSGQISEIELTITEGKFHQVKRMFESVGKKVIYLKRISMGSLRLPDSLAVGEYRTLTKEELALLKQQTN